MTQGSWCMWIPQRTQVSLSSLKAFFVKHVSVPAHLAPVEPLWMSWKQCGKRGHWEGQSLSLIQKGMMTKKKGCLLLWPQVLFGLQNRAISCPFLPRPTPDCQGKLSSVNFENVVFLCQGVQRAHFSSSSPQSARNWEHSEGRLHWNSLPFKMVLSMFHCVYINVVDMCKIYR